MNHNTDYQRSGDEAWLRVPTVLMGGPFDVGSAAPQLMGIMDLSATLLDVDGIPVPTDGGGRSALRLLLDEPVPWRDQVFFPVSERRLAFERSVGEPDGRIEPTPEHPCDEPWQLLDYGRYA